LGDVVDFAVGRGSPARATSALGHGVVIADAQASAAAGGSERGRQMHQQTRVAYQVLGGDEGSARLDLDRVQYVTVGELGADTTTGGGRPGVRPINILVELKPEDIKPVRAVVRIGDHDDAGQSLGLWLKPRRDDVVRAVLPIVRSGRAVRGPIAVCWFWQGKWCEGGPWIVGPQGRGRRIGSVVRRGAASADRGRLAGMPRVCQTQQPSGKEEPDQHASHQLAQS
jgi:hypothetical protein